MLYRFLVPFFSLYMLLQLVSNFRRGKRTLKELLFLTAFWVGLGYLGYHPETLSQFAKVIGFETGSNALFSFILLILLYGFGRLMMIVERLDTQLTALVRKEALRDSLESNDTKR